MYKIWTKQEENLLKTAYPLSEQDAFGMFPERTWNSIRKKACRMNLTKTYGYQFDDIEQAVLHVLQQIKVPILDKELIKCAQPLVNGKVRKTTLRTVISELKLQGYDIKEIIRGSERRYILVRNADVTTEDYYNILGSIKTPCILSSCWHIGSVGFSEQALYQMIEDVENIGIKDVVVVGDVLQGKGVHRLELSDLLVPSIDQQVQLAVDYFTDFPKGTQFHLTIGNHEQKLKGDVQVGYDVLKDISCRLPNVNYYGSTAKLKVDDDYDALLMHTKGGLTYSASYRLERIWGELIERPKLLVAGHLHKLMVLSKPPNNHLMFCGTLQRESSYLLWKGITAQVGWLILHEVTDENISFEIRTPRVY